MGITSIISVTLILAGSIIMVVSILFGLKSFQFLKKFDSYEVKVLQRFNTIHYIMMFAFLIGYLVVAMAIATGTEMIGYLFVGFIFFFGAVFVFLGVKLQAAMNSMLLSRYNLSAQAAGRLEKEQQKLVETNKMLEREIVEREQAEKKARERESRIDQILRGLPIGTLIIDAETLIIKDVNPAAEEVIGESRDTILGRPCNNFICDAEKRRCPMKVDGQNKFQGEHLLACSGGRQVPVLKTVSRIELEGKPHFLEVFIDIAEKKELEDKLQRSQRMEVIGTLAGSVAHDLNNILSGVINYPELMLMNLQETDPMHKPLTAIKNSGQRAAGIVQDLLTLARQNVAVKKVVDLGNIVREYMNSLEFEHLCRRHPEVVFTLEDEGGPFAMEGSTIHLGKSLMNLVTNGAEAIADQGEVVIRLENRYLDQPVPGYERVVEGEYAVLMVQDNGMGIAPEKIDKIFEPFYTSKVMGQSGSGLGMPVVRSTVKEHNGYIHVSSSEGEGTCFRLYFPASKRELSLEDEYTVNDVYRGNGQKILVVDDLEIQREIAGSLLSHLGYTVKTVVSGEDAVELLQDEIFDLVLLDMIMEPGMDGLETYQHIIGMRPKQKVILVSGYADKKRVQEMRKLGLSSHINKPYSLQGLSESVRVVLNTPLLPVDELVGREG